MAVARSDFSDLKRELGLAENVFGPSVFCEPRQELTEAARKRIPAILFSDRPVSDSRTALNAAHLERQLVAEGHPAAAAKWAICGLIQEGGLKAEIVLDLNPTMLDPSSEVDRKAPAGQNQAIDPLAALVDDLFGGPPTMVAIRPTPALRAAWLTSLAGTAVTIVVRADAAEADVLQGAGDDVIGCDDAQAGRRRAYARDHAWLGWYESRSQATFKSPATIRDTWNGLTEIERQAIAPRYPKKIKDKREGLQVVESALKIARKERQELQLD